MVEGSKRSVGGARLPRATSTTVRITRRYRVPARRVFDAWLQPAIAARWLFATATRPMTRVEIDARVGGRFRLIDESSSVASEHGGEYLAIEPYRRLIFTLSGQPDPSPRKVAVEIAEADGGCRLTLVQEGVPRSRAKQTKQRWIGVLYGLGVTLPATTSVVTEDLARSKRPPVRRLGAPGAPIPAWRARQGSTSPPADAHRPASSFAVERAMAIDHG